MTKIGGLLLVLSLVACGSSHSKLDGVGGGSAISGSGGTYGDAQAGGGASSSVAAGSEATLGGEAGSPGNAGSGAVAAGAGDVSVDGGTAADGGIGAEGGTAGTGEGGTAGTGEGGTAGTGEGGTAGTGEGGEAGAVSTVCDRAAARYCDDGNDCTEDLCDPSAGCQHQVVADGNPCDDRDICTSDDSCLAGACEGAAVHGQALATSELDAFGGYNESASAFDTPQGLSAVLSENLLVFAEFSDPGMSLKLVRVDPAGLTLIDRALTYSTLDWEPAGLWSSYLGTHLLAMTSTRIALVTSRFDIEIYDVVASKLKLQSYRYLSQDALDTSAILSVASGPSSADGTQRVWLMSSTSLSAYDIAASGSLSLVTTFSASKPVVAFAISDDGNTLYAGGQFGVEVIDVTDPLHPGFGTAPILPEVTEHRPYQIAVHGGYLLLQDELLYDSPGDLRVVRTSDFTEVAHFPATSTLDAAYSAPTGAAFVNGGLLLQRLSFVANESARLSAELYALDSGGPVLQSQWVYEQVAGKDGAQSWQPYPPTASGRLAIVGPSRRVVWAEGGTLTELKGKQQGTFEKVTGASPNHLLTYGTESTQVLDLSDPNLPVILAGGLLDPGATHPTRVDVPNSPQSRPEQLNVEDDCSWLSGTGRITQFSDSGNTEVAPQPVGELTIACGAAQTVSSGLVYRVIPNVDGSWEFDTFELPTAPVSQFTPAPIESARLTGSVKVTAQPAVQIAADCIGHDLVIALQSADPEDTTQLTVDWFSRDSGSWVLAGSVQLPKSEQSQRSVLVQGGRAVVVSPNLAWSYPWRIDVIRRGGTQTYLEKTWSPDIADVQSLFPQGALGIVGPDVYVVMRQKDSIIGVNRTFVKALSLDSLETVATYAVSQVPRSMATVNGHLFFGGHSMIASALPQCP